MKLFELYNKPVFETTETGEIPFLLSVVDDPGTLHKIEKYLKVNIDWEPEQSAEPEVDTDVEDTQVTEAQASNEKRIDAIQALLAQTSDQSLIDKVESLLRETALTERVDKLWKARKFDNRRMSIYKEPFSDMIKLAPSSVKSKIQLLYWLTNNEPAITKESISTSYRKSIDELVPSKLVSNETYQAIKKKMFFSSTFRGKGIGPAEFALALLGKDGNIVDARGDIVIDGWGIELKDGRAGSLKPGNVSNTHRVADAARDELGQKLGITFAKGAGNFDQKFMLHRDNEFVRAMKALPPSEQQKLMLDWANKLYPGLDAKVRKELVLNIVSDLGTPAAKQHYGPPILTAYKSKDDWDSIMFVSPDETVVNVVDPIDSKHLLAFNPTINRGGDTQALPDGYVNAGIPKQ